ncbi:MAG: tRNA lysidine(34) synthetase TilS [Clostridia bacterium]|nr:tRNA lysidine(34) synthetase TilS [Clostridia bacterium]
MIDLSLIKKGDVVAVALSGGLDSVCLLHMLNANAKTHGYTVKAVHVNHSIRGIYSDNDQAFCEEYCKKLGTPFKTFTVDAPKYSEENHLSLEQGARALRYSHFFSLLEQGWCTKIATAHHIEDNFETVLLNLFRGTGLKGLSGIKSKVNSVIRPLLSYSKADLMLYAKRNDLNYVTDETNKDVNYTRNYIRHNLTPVITSKFPEAISAVSRTSLIIAEEDAFLNDLSKSALEVKGEKIYVSTKNDNVILRRAVILALNALGVEKDYEWAHVESVLNLIKNQSGKAVNLPKNVIALKEYDKIVFFVSQNNASTLNEYSYKKGEFAFKNKTAVICDGKLENVKTSLIFDGAKIPPSAKIRLRRDGDTFEKFGGGTKKLKEFLIDKKIPLLERDDYPVIASGNKVYVIFGLAISESVKVTEKTKKIFEAKLK